MKIKIIILTTFLLSNFAFAFHPPLLKENLNIVDGNSLKSDSGIRGPNYKAQVLDLQELAKKYVNAKYVHYGDSIKNRPLSAILFTPKDVALTSISIVTGATHGNEYLNIVDRLPRAILADKDNSLERYLGRGGAVLFVPILNPDGYESRSRHNSRWADLNRDWPNPANNYQDFKQPESKALAKWIDSFIENNKIKMDIAVDYHCCVQGTLLLPWGYKKGEHMGTLDAAKSLSIQQMFKTSFKEYGDIGTPPDILYSAVGTTLDYWFDKYGAVSFTYEGRRSIEVDKLDEHVNWWNKIFASL
jgi:predicted deacylase